MHVRSQRQWLIPLGTPHATRMRLFCFPPAGSGTVAYRAWAPLAAPGLEVNAVLLPGRETRFAEPPVDDMAALASQIADAIAPLAGQPFALFGHSLGALLAYEVARRLAAQGCAPGHLFASGHLAPAIGSRRAQARMANSIMAVRRALRPRNGSASRSRTSPCTDGFCRSSLGPTRVRSLQSCSTCPCLQAPNSPPT